MKLWKSKEEKEIERKIAARQGKKSVERHIQRQRQKIGRYLELAKRSVRLKDNKRFRQIANYILATQRDVTEWEQRLLYFDMVEARRDQVLAAADFAQAYQQMAKSMLASSNPADMAKIQHDIELGLARAEMMDTMLENLLDMSEDILTEMATENKPGEIEQLMAALQTEAEAEGQGVDDAELEASIKAIEDQLNRSY